MPRVLDRIRSDKKLKPYIGCECAENGMSIDFGTLSCWEDYISICVDCYYNDLGLTKTPPSPDCLVVYKCTASANYGIAIIELKSTTSAKQLDKANIKNKYRTVLDDFIPKRFKNLLDRSYEVVQLLLISNVDHYKKGRDVGLTIEYLMSFRVSAFGKIRTLDLRYKTAGLKKC